MPRTSGAKNIENPLKEGMPAKIYLLAYSGKLHAYKIADVLKYGWNPPENKKRANASKVYEYVKKYEDYFYKDEKNKYIVDGRPRIPIKTHVDPLIKEIESVAGETFTDETQETLHNFFDDDVIRSYVFSYVKKTDFKKDIDSFGYIMVVLSSIVKSMYFTKKQLEREKTPAYKIKEIFSQKNRFSHMLRNKEMTEQTEQVLFNILPAYLPSDIKAKYKPNRINDEFKLIFKVFDKIFDLDNDILEILMKMPSIYEADIIMEAGLAALPEVLDKTK